MRWTRRRKLWVATLSVVTAAAVSGTVLLLWVPIQEENDGYTMVGSSLYSYETVYPGGSAGSNFTYRGVFFSFSAPVTCPENPGGGALCALVTESGGPTYWYNVSFPPPSTSWGSWITWVAPDHHEGVEIRTCSSAMPFHLLVAA